LLLSSTTRRPKDIEASKTNTLRGKQKQTKKKVEQGLFNTTAEVKNHGACNRCREQEVIKKVIVAKLDAELKAEQEHSYALIEEKTLQLQNMVSVHTASNKMKLSSISFTPKT
jgi:hypothetical protein